MLTTGSNTPGRTRPRPSTRTLVVFGAVFLAGIVMPASSRAETRVLFAASFLSYDVGRHANSVAIEDLNGDGKPDLVAANYVLNTVSVLLGHGDGTYAAEVEYVTGNHPGSVAIGDLNGDGKPDLAVADEAGVSVLLGNGDGTFGTKQDHGTVCTFVAIGDLNGDGKPDLAAVNGCCSGVSVLLGNGDGTFGIGAVYGTGNHSYSVTIGDLDGDGKPDLVTANWYDWTVSVLLGHGDGTFGPRNDFATAGLPSIVAIGDFNGDSRPDLAVAAGSGVSVLLGTGGGNFGPKQDYPTAAVGTTDGVVIGDLNGDSKLDVAVLSYSDSAVSVLLGNGDGTFGTGSDYTTGSLPYSVAIGDLNGDGKPDLAVSNLDADGSVSTVSVLLGNGDGTLGSKNDYATATTPRSVAVGDLNGDRKPDVATANSGSNSVSVLLGNGDGTFGTKVDYGAGLNPQSVATADLNGDGKPDLAVVNKGNWDPNSHSVSVLLGNGDGTFGSKTDYLTGSYPTSVAIGDMNGDGRPDLAAANASGSSVSVLLGNGDGTFAAAHDFGTSGDEPDCVVMGDMNGDGKLDLVVANRGSAGVVVMFGNGDGTIGTSLFIATGTDPYAVAIGDLNGDGKQDLVVPNSSDNTASVMLGNGDGTFQAKTDYAVGCQPMSVAIGDLTRDRKRDLVIGNWGDNTVSVLIGNGDGTFSSKSGYGTGNYPNSVAIGDMNLDRNPDLVTANSVANTVSALLNISPLIQCPPAFNLISPAGGDSAHHVDAALTLSWHVVRTLACSDTVGFKLFWSADADFAQAESLSVGADTSYTIPPNTLVGDQWYYWRVKAQDPQERVRLSNPPAGWSFRLIPIPPVIPCPGAFNLISPAAGDTTHHADGDLALSWHGARALACSDTVHFELFWSADSTFSQAESLSVGADTSYTIPPNTLAGGQWYHWRVKARDPREHVRLSNPPAGWPFRLIPATPLSVQPTAAAQEDGILVSWQVFHGTGLTGFKVYRRSGGSDWDCIAANVPYSGETGSYLDANADAGVLYDYEVEAFGSGGSAGRFGPVSADLPAPARLTFELLPNTGAGVVMAVFALPRPGNVVLRVIDTQGHEVTRSSWNGLRAGVHRQPLEPRDADGNALSSRVYFVRLETPSGNKVARWVVVR